MSDQRHDPVALTPGKARYTMYRRLDGPPGPVWTGAENLAHTKIRSPDRPSRSESLYRLNYRGPPSRPASELQCDRIFHLSPHHVFTLDRATSPLREVLLFQRTWLLMTARGSIRAASFGRKGKRYRIFLRRLHKSRLSGKSVRQ